MSHLATILGLKDSLETALIAVVPYPRKGVVRTLAYLLVALVLYQVAFRAK